MQTKYRIKEHKEGKNVFFQAQFKPWWFPFAWFACYEIHFCCYYETAVRVCELHHFGKIFTEDELHWVISKIDVSPDTTRTGT